MIIRKMSQQFGSRLDILNKRIGIFFLITHLLLSLVYFTTQIYVTGITFPGCKPENTTYIDEYDHEIISKRLTFQTNFREYMQVDLFHRQPRRKRWIAHSPLVRELMTLHHLQDVYVTSYNMICNQSCYIRFWRDIISRERINRKMKTASLYYEDVIYPYALFSFVFGHFIHDSLPLILQMPQDIFNKSKIILQYPPDLAFHFTDILGIPRDKFIYEPNKYIYVRNLYVLTPVEEVNAQLITGFPHLIQVLRNNLKINNNKPKLYIMSNRPTGRRHLLNFDNLTIAIQKNYPKLNWKVVQLNFTKVHQTAKILSCTLLWFSPCGSNMNNIIFMQERTGICMAMGEITDYPNFAIAHTVNIWAIGFHNPKLRHLNPEGGYCLIPSALRAISIMLRTLKFQKWPHIDYYEHPFNINLTKEVMNGNMTAKYVYYPFYP